MVKEPFDHPDYLFELKHDGQRTFVQWTEISVFAILRASPGTLRESFENAPTQVLSEVVHKRFLGTHRLSPFLGTTLSLPRL
jgi:hypothetical protein